MRCSKCGADNAAGSRFCNQCATPLTRTCPKCGRANAPDAKFCAECAEPLTSDTTKSTARASSAPPVRTAPQQPDSAAADGERKTVTALFADIKGSTELEQDLDPEEARAIVDPALKLMIDAVRRYDGYVVQSTGDGIFAMFGAPLAHEDHAQRALYAALRMLEELRSYAGALRERGRAPIEIRVGVNTGEVVVRAIQTAEGHAEYTPIGHATNLASRMQTVAATGTIATTENTRKLCEGYFTFRALGPTRIKGVSEAVNVHEVTGLGALRTRLQASARRGLSKFVGREAELTQMKNALASAKSGRGQIVAAVAEAGVGKSRLFYEFQAIRDSEAQVLETLAVPHGKASAYLPLIDLLKNYFGITAEDDARKRREKIGGKILILDRALEDTLPYMFALLEVSESGDAVAQMDAEVRRRRTLDAIKRLLLRESLKQPLILIFEDLHWIDEGSGALLNILAESIGTARVMMLVNYRPEFTHQWGNKTYYTQLRLDPLTADSAEEMLDALLGPDAQLAALKKLVTEKTEGNPFFMEEIVQSLFEQGALLRNGTVKLAKSLSAIQIPSTVQAVLASRIDRLPPGQKDLLQTLAIIGKEFPRRLVREVSGRSDDELDRLLAGLQTAEFIYEQPSISDVAYVFKHALSQQVAAGSALVERRKVLHQRVARVLEAKFPETAETEPELVAHHYTEAGLGAEAIPYWYRAGKQALRRWANLEAIDHLKQGLELLGSSPSASEGSNRPFDSQRFSMLFVLGEAQTEAGRFLEARETLLSAADVAKSLESAESLAKAALRLAHSTWLAGTTTPAVIRWLEEALQRFGREDNPVTSRILAALSRSLGLMGDQHRAMAYAEQAVAMARRFGDPELVADSLHGMFFALWGPQHAAQRLKIAKETLDLARTASEDVTELQIEAVWARAFARLETGDVAAADADNEEMRRWGEETNRPFTLSLGTVFCAARAAMSGRFEDSERLAQQALAYGQRIETEASSGIFGIQMFAVRREQGRLKEIEPVVRVFLQQHSADGAWRPGLAVIFSDLGLVADARAEFEILAEHDFDDLPLDMVWMGTMAFLVDVCTFLQDGARAETLYRKLVPFAGMNAVVGNAAACYGAVSRYLGALATTLERWDDASRHFEDALAMNARMDARTWLAHTHHQYAAMLLARNDSGDREKAIELLDAALATTRELGMRALEERITAVQARMKAELN